MSLSFSQYIDHTLLKAEASSKQVETLCQEAIEYQFKTVCLNPCYISLAKKHLKNSSVEICTVIGFPLGANTTATKVFETESAISEGADEIDMVINIGALKEKNDLFVEQDIHSVVQAAQGKTVKVIFETCLLNSEEIRRACKLSLKAGAGFVKTSTGFSKSGASIEAVKIMLEEVEGRAQVKASGGIRDPETARAYIEAGATRLGTSSGVAIAKGLSSREQY
jgi:deoxyribose-phosphate aldolase